MAYTSRNFRTKKALKEAVAAGERITVYQPGMGSVPENGRICVEGPHFPEPHRWYAEVILRDGIVASVK